MRIIQLMRVSTSHKIICHLKLATDLKLFRNDTLCVLKLWGVCFFRIDAMWRGTQALLPGIYIL